jgi:ribosomal protein S18 acetylase RimI-like enzyme
LFQFEKDSTDFNTIQQLAEEIWPVAYAEILSKEQLRYMLDLFYAEDSLRQQYEEKKHRFIIAYDIDQSPCGFASFSPISETENRFKLHKLYVLPLLQGMGLGRALIEHVIQEIKTNFPIHLELNVNRHNEAVHFYRKCGFTIIREEDIEIGNGYFMNDFVMEKMI